MDFWRYSALDLSTRKNIQYSRTIFNHSDTWKARENSTDRSKEKHIPKALSLSLGIHQCRTHIHTLENEFHAQRSCNIVRDRYKNFKARERCFKYLRAFAKSKLREISILGQLKIVGLVLPCREAILFSFWARVNTEIATFSSAVNFIAEISNINGIASRFDFSLKIFGGFISSFNFLLNPQVYPLLYASSRDFQFNIIYRLRETSLYIDFLLHNSDRQSLVII